MGVLLVSSHRSGAGKTSLIAALLAQISAEGHCVAYYKPFSASPSNDADISFISDSILADTGSPSVPAPLPLPQNDLGNPLITESQAQTIRQSLSEIRSNAAVVLIEAPDILSPTGDAWSFLSELADVLESSASVSYTHLTLPTNREV